MPIFVLLVWKLNVYFKVAGTKKQFGEWTQFDVTLVSNIHQLQPQNNLPGMILPEVPQKCLAPRSAPHPRRPSWCWSPPPQLSVPRVFSAPDAWPLLAPKGEPEKKNTQIRKTTMYMPGNSCFLRAFSLYPIIKTTLNE